MTGDHDMTTPEAHAFVLDISELTNSGVHQCSICNLPESNQRHVLSVKEACKRPRTVSEIPMQEGEIMSVMQEQTVTLRIRVHRLVAPPSEWDWPSLVDEPDVVLVDASPVTEYRDLDDGGTL